MSYQLEIAHQTPRRTRLVWTGEGAPSQELLGAIAASPAVARLDYRPATGSLVLAHERGFGAESLARLARPFAVNLSQKPAGRASRAARAAANGARKAPRSEAGAETGRAGPSGAADASKWAPIVADVEAVVLLGLIFGWIQDWFAARSITLGTAILVILTAIALVAYWLRRRSRSVAAEPELEYIYA